MFVQITVGFDALPICHGRKVEQEPVFSYVYRVLIDDHQYGLWVVAYMERVVRTCAAVLTAAYKHYKLWNLTPDTISFALRLVMDMLVVLGSHGDFSERLKTLEVIKSTLFEG